MEMVYFTIVAIILYVVSDWILNQIEKKRGERLEHRSVIFFIIIIILSITTFSIIQQVLVTPPQTTDKEATQIEQPKSPGSLQ